MTSTIAAHVPPLRGRVAAEVRAFIARHGLTQVRLAELLHWHQPYLSRRLTGHVPFNTDDLAALAELFEVDPEEFLRGPSEPGKTPGEKFVHLVRALICPAGITFA